MKQKYYMENFEEFVKKIIQNCRICHEGKVYTMKTKEECLKLASNEPFESIYIDFCGPFKLTNTREKYIFAIIDQYSKYILLKAVKNQDDKTLINISSECWLLKFGSPRSIHVDHGRCDFIEF